MNQNANNKTMLAVVLIVVALVLAFWQIVLRPSPNAVGVSDMPESTKLKDAERAPNAGPLPVDVSKKGGAAPAKR